MAASPYSNQQVANYVVRLKAREGYAYIDESSNSLEDDISDSTITSVQVTLTPEKPAYKLNINNEGQVDQYTHTVDVPAAGAAPNTLTITGILIDTSTEPATKYVVKDPIFTVKRIGR